MALTGGDEIQVRQENDDHDNDNVDIPSGQHGWRRYHSHRYRYHRRCGR